MRLDTSRHPGRVMVARSDMQVVAKAPVGLCTFRVFHNRVNQLRAAYRKVNAMSGGPPGVAIEVSAHLFEWNVADSPSSFLTGLVQHPSMIPRHLQVFLYGKNTSWGYQKFIHSTNLVRIELKNRVIRLEQRLLLNFVIKGGEIKSAQRTHRPYWRRSGDRVHWRAHR